MLSGTITSICCNLIAPTFMPECRLMLLDAHKFVINFVIKNLHSAPPRSKASLPACCSMSSDTILEHLVRPIFGYS